MLNRQLTIGLILVVSLFCTVLPAAQSQMVYSSRKTGQTWIVKWRTKVPASFWRQAEQIGNDEEGVYLVRLRQEADVEKWRQRWKTHPGVEYLHPNVRYDPGYRFANRNLLSAPGKSYYLYKTRFPQAWDFFQRKADLKKVKPITVAVVDTGVDLSHPILKPFLTEGINVKDPQAPPEDHFGHGTKVAGVIAATWGVRHGPAVGAGKIMPIKVMENGGDGEVFYTVKGIREAIRHNADIIVLAQGSWAYSRMMEEAISEAEEQGVLVVAAVGNSDYDLNQQQLYDRPLYYPAAFPSVLSVGAVNVEGNHFSISNTGPGLDLVAPGDMIYTTTINDSFSFESGTSFAAPQVAGAAALVWQLHPDYSAREIRMLLSQTASKPSRSPEWDEKTGFGILNAYRALRTTGINPDPGEPNDSPQQARLFSLSQELDLVLTEGDQDWYVLNLDQAGKLHIDLVHNGSKEKVQLFVHQLPAKRKQSYSLLPQAGKNRIEISVPKGKTYFRWTVPQKVAGQVKLKFHVTFSAAADNYEKNDMLSQAAPLPVKETKAVYEATISKQGDIDWYQVVLTEPGDLNISVQPGTPRFDPVIFKVQADNWEKMRYDEKNEGGTETLQLNVEPGQLYFRVTDYAGNPIDRPYQIAISFEQRDSSIYENKKK
ncbi:S8 family peptidase [Thermoactinomyces mirandus]|uniref:S8 family serine peptidase n=1 Tax=Thermoactinomyces mirandus TaxID=2756294 RepID=A0A7W1XUK9_9BACL|nr:S8 family serine peptidase [Thermoactinomyces mirandus]MBA4603478.1 S8 family serine peptidase [Thermoactinomyces mirandus]